MTSCDARSGVPAGTSGSVTAAMVVLGDSAVQLQAFAAPRHEGIWREVSEEIASGISQQGGTADTTDGPFGPELLGRVPAQQPDGKVGFQPMRFVGTSIDITACSATL